MDAYTLVNQQQILEERYSSNELIPRIKRELKDTPDIMNLIDTSGISKDFALTALTHLMLMKRANVPTMIGLLRHFYTEIQDVADMLKKCIQIDLIDYDVDNKVFITKWLINDNLQLELDRFQFPLPMVIKPKKLRNNMDTGYLKNHRSVILNNNHTDEDVCLDHLNRLNSIPLMLDMDTAYFIKNKWRNIDHKKEGESYDDYKARRKAFEKYNETTLWNMEMLSQISNKIYLTHSYDKRGRTYCNGYHINYQGNSWNKGVILFAHGDKYRHL